MNEKKREISKLDLEKEYLEKTQNNKNPAPIQILDEELQTIIFEVANTYGFNIDYIMFGILTASAIAIGKSCQLKVKENWIVKVNLFTVIIGRPGDAKTPTLKFCFKPIIDEDNQYYEDYELELKEFKKIKDKEGIEKPILKKNLISDFTPEALTLAHKVNKNGLGVFSDELNTWLKNMNRYNNSGEEDNYLSIWSGTPITIDRASGKSIRIKDPCISVIGGIQPKIIAELTKGNKGDNGFLDRLLFVYPENIEKIKWNNKKIKPIYLSNYQNIISNLLNLKCDNTESNPKLYTIEKNAQKYLNKWQNENTTNDLFEYERGISIKLEDYIFRFILILHLISAATKNKNAKKEIPLSTIKNGIQLYEYFFFNAMKVRDQLIPQNYLDTLTPLKKEIIEQLPNSFTTGEGTAKVCKIINGRKQISERSFMTFLRDRRIFKRISHGKYEKVIKK